MKTICIIVCSMIIGIFFGTYLQYLASIRPIERPEGYEIPKLDKYGWQKKQDKKGIYYSVLELSIIFRKSLL